MEYYFNISILLLSFVYSSYCDKFYYFAYGSNLLQRRLKLNNPSAEFYSVAVLENHRLDFNIYSELWNGAAATIVEDPGETVTGALWTMNSEDIPHLDEQESVHTGWYYVKNVTVATSRGDKVVARTYAETEQPPERGPSEDLPFERRPSNTYLEVLILGAVESRLPSDYVGYLVSFPTNGNHATETIRNQLGYPFGK